MSPITSWIFPGQGSQSVGMGAAALAASPAARAVLAEAEAALGEPLGQLPRAIERRELLVAADRVAGDHDQRHRPLPAELVDRLPERGVVRERDLAERDASLLEQHLSADADPAPLGGVEDDTGHEAF